MSIAVVGASPREVSLGYKVLDNILTYGFQGTIFPVNPPDVPRRCRFVQLYANLRTCTHDSFISRNFSHDRTLRLPFLSSIPLLESMYIFVQCCKYLPIDADIDRLSTPLDVPAILLYNQNT